MTKLFFSFAAAAAASLATIGAVAPAAASPGAPAGIAVSHADLNLSQAGDRRILTERLERAARRVCRAETGHSPLDRDAARDCREAAVSQAIERVGFPDDATD